MDLNSLESELSKDDVGTVVVTLGTTATGSVDPLPEIGTSVEDFIKLDRDAENQAIVLYRKVIAEATRLGDIKTKKLFEDILVDEERHYWNFDDFLP